jgi:hypothetical protein
MLAGMDMLSKKVRTKHREFTPTDTQLAMYIITSKGITPKQVRTEFTIPEILEFVWTELYLKKKEAEAHKKSNKR